MLTRLMGVVQRTYEVERMSLVMFAGSMETVATQESSGGRGGGGTGFFSQDLECFPWELYLRGKSDYREYDIIDIDFING